MGTSPRIWCGWPKEVGASYVFYCVKRREQYEKENALWCPYSRPNTPEMNCLHTERMPKWWKREAMNPPGALFVVDEMGTCMDEWWSSPHSSQVLPPVVVHIRVTLLSVGEGLPQNEGIRSINKGPTKYVLALILKSDCIVLCNLFFHESPSTTRDTYCNEVLCGHPS